jgi:predicted helicase
MRRSLMQTFNRIYVLDLHGSTKKKEKTPEGGKDENVFDIEQGVCISIMVRQPGLEPKIFHADLWGKRQDKYRACMEMEFEEVSWDEIQPKSPFYLFVPQDESLRAEYENGWKINDIFPVNSVGVVTADDQIFIGFDEAELKQKIRSKFDEYESAFNVSILYRPFDTRTIYFDQIKLERPREKIMHHMLAGKNMGICCPRGQEISGGWEHVFITEQIIQHHTVSMKEVNYLFPLYLFNNQVYKEQNRNQNKYLFVEEPRAQYNKRRENLSPEFRQFIDEKYGHHYEPEEILGYIYAVLHSPAYRQKYAGFLKIDFPRIPFVGDRRIFEPLAGLGWRLVQAHLLKDIPELLKVDITKGSDAVEKPSYDTARQRLYINADQFFAPVPEDVWNFHIGGYQVLDKYLKSRKGRRLSLDEKENIINVVNALRFTIDMMQEIDDIWQP